MIDRSPFPAHDRLLDYNPKNPLREVSWRWGRAGHLLESGRKLSRRRDDRWVRSAFAFRSAMSACGAPADFYVLAEEHPAVFWAYRLWHMREDPDHRLHTHALEARLLADQEHGEIADRLAIDPAIVEAYAACYFDVKPHLLRASTDYLMFRVLRDAVYRGLRERHYDMLWKLFALWGGPHILDALISTFIAPGRPHDAAGVLPYIKDAVEGKLALKAMIGIQAIDATGTSPFTTAGQVLDLYLRQVDIEKKSGGGDGGKMQILNNVGTMLGGLPWSVGRKSSAELGRTPEDVGALAVYDASGVELSGGEILGLGVGQTPDLELVGDGFPSPPDRVAS
jgi:hypothetical protein